MTAGNVTAFQVNVPGAHVTSLGWLNDKEQGDGDDTVFGMNLSAFMLLLLTDMVEA